MEGGTERLIEIRALARSEIRDIWQIDRAEVIERVHRLVDGSLELQAHHFKSTGWPSGQRESDTPQFEDCFDRGGWFLGSFEHGRMVAVVILENRFFGAASDMLQLRFLHVDQRYRGQGLGVRLFNAAMEEAWRRGAMCHYVSATETQNTMDFYLRQGCTLAETPDPVMYAREPKDIRLELRRA